MEIPWNSSMKNLMIYVLQIFKTDDCPVRYVKQPPVPVPYVPGMSAPLPGCAAYLPTLPPKQVDTGNGEARIELGFSKDIIGCVTLYNDII